MLQSTISRDHATELLRYFDATLIQRSDGAGRDRRRTETTFAKRRRRDAAAKCDVDLRLGSVM